MITRDNEANEARLQIKKLLPADTGTYGCFYSEESRNLGVYKELELRVKFAPVVTVSPEKLTVEIGEKFELECKVLSHPPSKITWFQNEEFLEEDETKLRFVDANSKTAGKFSCVAENEIAKTSAFATIDLNFIEPKVTSNFDEEIFVFEGDRFSLPCDATGLPAPSLSWSRNGDSRSVANANPLQFVRASKETTSGVWTCLAENEFGTDNVSVKVNVVSKTTFAQDLIEVNIDITGQHTSSKDHCYLAF